VGAGALSGLCRLLNEAQVLSSGFAGPTICNQVKGDLLAFIESAQACTLHGGDVDKNIITAVIRRNKPKALLAVEPFHSSIAQESHPSKCDGSKLCTRSRLVEYWGEGR